MNAYAVSLAPKHQIVVRAKCLDKLYTVSGNKYSCCNGQVNGIIVI